MKLKRNEQLKRKKEKKLKRHKRNKEDFFLKSYARSHGLFLDLFFSHLTFKSWKLKAFSILLVFSLMSKLIQIKSRYAKATVLMVVDKRIFSKIFVISVYDIQRLLFPLFSQGRRNRWGGGQRMGGCPLHHILADQFHLSTHSRGPDYAHYITTSSAPRPPIFRPSYGPVFSVFYVLGPKKKARRPTFCERYLHNLNGFWLQDF